MPHVDAGDDGPDAVGEHERNAAERVCIKEKSGAAYQIDRVIPDAVIAQPAVLVANESDECEECRENAEEFHPQSIPCPGGQNRTADLIFMSDVL